jgi:UPF0755 protein
MRRIGTLIFIAGLAVLALGAIWFAAGWVLPGPLAKEQSVVVSTGSTLRGVARDLKARGAVRSADAFVARARIFGSAAPVKAGEYAIPKGASGREILALLQSGRVVHHLIVIPEGMPSILVHERLLAEPNLTGAVALPAEGSVLPDSYAYQKGESRAAVLGRMQAAMKAYLVKAWTQRSPKTVARTPQDAIILASIVEKETAVPAERPTVAGVYSNRLRQGMMLQADPTIIYPITRGKPLGRRILRSEIAAVNGYNTYAMTGLPKGPIANPGRAAIDAVLNPAETRALYFVADGKGGHIFSETLEQQNENVRKWFEIRRQRGEL